MGHITLLTTATSIPPELLAQLEPNDPMTGAHWWPLALGYWVLMFLTLITTAWLTWLWIKNAPYRRYTHYLKSIQSAPVMQQHDQVHLLLRKILQDKSSALASVEEQYFSERVKKTLNLEHPPAWVNAHYSQHDNAEIDWQQVKRLIQRWSQESTR